MIFRRFQRRRYLLVPASLLLLVAIWQFPALIKALPSRYVAAYLPESIQALSVREHVETLPTAVISANADSLLSLASTTTDSQLSNTSAISSTRPSPTPLSTSTAIAAAPVSTIQDDSHPSPMPSPTSEPTPTPIPIPATTRLSDFHHHFQTWNNCGPATLAMGLSYFDLFVTQEQTASELKPNPEDRNVRPDEMVRYVNDFTNVNALDRVNGDLNTILRLTAYGYPVIVEIGLDPPGEYRWMEWYGHYLLIVAYDLEQEKIWVYDSWFGTSAVPGENADPNGREISFNELDRYWQQFNRSYIVLFDSGERNAVEQIIGSNMIDDIMWQNSLKRAQDSLADHPNDKFLWFNLGSSYNALVDYEKAAAAFDQARSLELPWRMLWYQFGPYEAYYQVGRFEDVLLLTDITLQDRPYFEESYYYRGLALEALGNNEEAISNYEKAIKFNPNYEEALAAIEAFDG